MTQKIPGYGIYLRIPPEEMAQAEKLQGQGYSSRKIFEAGLEKLTLALTKKKADVQAVISA